MENQYNKETKKSFDELEDATTDAYKMLKGKM